MVLNNRYVISPAKIQYESDILIKGIVKKKAYAGNDPYKGSPWLKTVVDPEDL